MKKVVLEHLEKLPTSIWEVIHLCAEANGSVSRIDLQVMDETDMISSKLLSLAGSMSAFKDNKI